MLDIKDNIKADESELKDLVQLWQEKGPNTSNLDKFIEKSVILININYFGSYMRNEHADNDTWYGDYRFCIIFTSQLLKFERVNPLTKYQISLTDESDTLRQINQYVPDELKENLRKIKDIITNETRTYGITSKCGSTSSRYRRGDVYSKLVRLILSEDRPEYVENGDFKFIINYNDCEQLPRYREEMDSMDIEQLLRFDRLSAESLQGKAVGQESVKAKKRKYHSPDDPYLYLHYRGRNALYYYQSTVIDALLNGESARDAINSVEYVEPGTVTTEARPVAQNGPAPNIKDSIRKQFLAELFGENTDMFNKMIKEDE